MVEEQKIRKIVNNRLFYLGLIDENCTPTSGATGTVTNTGGALTNNSIVLGAGTVDTKVAAGIITDGISLITLGVNATTIGKLKMFGGTSGDATIQPSAIAGTATVQTLPATTGTLVNRVATANGVSASNTDGALTVTLGAITPTTVNGNTFTTGSSTFTGTAAQTYTFPTTTSTLARTDAAQTFTGIQTFSTPIDAGSVATMTATVGGGVPTPPNNSTTFLRGDGVFGSPSVAGYIINGGNSLSAAITIGTNDANSLNLETNNVTKLSLSSAGTATFTPTITATGALKGIVYTGVVNTNQTLSTEIPSITLTTAGREWATGAIATQREVLITQPTYSFVGASTITNAATLGIAGAPIKSTNATITNTHGILVQAGAVSTATNSYGLSVNTQTGATTNYAAQFLGGNVGIGTSTPTAKINIAAGSATALTAPLKFTSGALMTSAEVGAVEFLTDALYITTTTGTKRRMITAGSTGRAVAQVAANSSVATFTTPAVDGTYEISANVLVTTSSSESFSVSVIYTDEGNTSRTQTLILSLLAGTTSNLVAFSNGAVPYAGVSSHIRCKASTAITIQTTGTFTGCTYNVDGVIKQTA